MLSFPPSPSVRIFVGREPVDMRKQFTGLFALATEQLGGNIFSGSLFIFSNRSRNRLKILYWDRGSANADRASPAG